MSALRATAAVVRYQLDRRFAGELAITFALLLSATTLFGSLLIRPAPREQFLALVVAVLASGELQWRLSPRIRDVLYFTLPLYGRQLARAYVVPMLLCAIAAPLGVAGGGMLAHSGPGFGFTFVVCASLAGSIDGLVILSAAFREGAAAWLFRGLGFASGCAAGASILAGKPLALPLAILATFVLGFVALRQLGETIARFDPVP
jgi:hypothetical protein